MLPQLFEEVHRAETGGERNRLQNGKDRFTVQSRHISRYFEVLSEIALYCGNGFPPRSGQFDSQQHSFFPEQLPETAPNFTSHVLPDFSIPVVQQDNSVDCGVYMLNNVKKLLLMSDAFEIRCDHNDAAAVQKAFQPLRLGGNEVKLLRRQIAGAIDGLARSLGKDEFEEEEEDSIE